MNVCFYISIDRLPLATVAAIEFIGPIVLAAIGARTPRNVAAVATAAAGVYLLTHVQFEGEPVGVAFAFANAALFTAYIVLAHRVARRSGLNGIDGLAAAMLLAFLFVSPIGLSSAAAAFSDPVAIAAGIGVGVTSSVIPYVFDQLAMARLAPRDVRAVRRAPTGDGDRHRRHRAAATAVPRRSRRYRAGNGRDRAASGVGCRRLNAFHFLCRALDLSLRSLGAPLGLLRLGLGFLRRAFRLGQRRPGLLQAFAGLLPPLVPRGRRLARSGSRFRPAGTTPGRDRTRQPSSLRAASLVRARAADPGRPRRRGCVRGLVQRCSAELPAGAGRVACGGDRSVLLDRLRQVGAALPRDHRFLGVAQPLSQLGQRPGL